MCNAPVLVRPSPIKVASSSLSSSSSSLVRPNPPSLQEQMSASSPLSCSSSVADDYPETSMPQHRHDDGFPPKGKGGVVKAFPIKLHDMLDDESLDEIVSWQSHGRCFVVRDHKRFASEVMPQYFKQTKFASFQRQLNLYGFQRFTQGQDKNGYYHEYFLRGQRHLCSSMIRMKVKGTKVRKATQPEKQPNFYAMPPMPSLQKIRSIRSRGRALTASPPNTNQPDRIVSDSGNMSTAGGSIVAMSAPPPLRPLPPPIRLPPASLAPGGTALGQAPGPAVVTPPVVARQFIVPSSSGAARPPAPPLATRAPQPTPSMTASASEVSLSSIDTAASISSASRPLPPEVESVMCPQTVEFLEGLYGMLERTSPPPPVAVRVELLTPKQPMPIAVEASSSSNGDVCYFAGRPFYYIEDFNGVNSDI
mmetsp:Transcript_48414/g.89796  ORF Transcript_48414/g.89796 Transcript_48414/m.89796 type:complete len:421 (-) Transcript_48414:201-1463(-)|eukprot:CAMPEP_0197452184 /NCGR_PEP_ID=MMETSP1175-20131217/31376_1 /TAXON_ID=1003142 /ORGANISM="Triceratium dubium, Strain CCMP147" /LENGTH=420 /DNA_ID=CAMNT_0042985129 /DNA_START=103 /DNA_END=1365 /DNA_ORIENTATION=-